MRCICEFVEGVPAHAEATAPEHRVVLNNHQRLAQSVPEGKGRPGNDEEDRAGDGILANGCTASPATPSPATPSPR